MMVCRDLETGPVHPSIGSAPSTGTCGMSLSVTTFMITLLVLTGVQDTEIAMCPQCITALAEHVGDRLHREPKGVGILGGSLKGGWSDWNYSVAVAAAAGAAVFGD